MDNKESATKISEDSSVINRVIEIASAITNEFSDEQSGLVQKYLRRIRDELNAATDSLPEDKRAQLNLLIARHLLNDFLSMLLLDASYISTLVPCRMSEFIHIAAKAVETVIERRAMDSMKEMLLGALLGTRPESPKDKLS